MYVTHGYRFWPHRKPRHRDRKPCHNKETQKITLVTLAQIPPGTNYGPDWEVESLTKLWIRIAPRVRVSAAFSNAKDR